MEHAERRALFHYRCAWVKRVLTAHVCLVAQRQHTYDFAMSLFEGCSCMRNLDKLKMMLVVRLPEAGGTDISQTHNPDC